MFNIQYFIMKNLGMFNDELKKSVIRGFVICRVTMTTSLNESELYTEKTDQFKFQICRYEKSNKWV